MQCKTNYPKISANELLKIRHAGPDPASSYLIRLDSGLLRNDGIRIFKVSLIARFCPWKWFFIIPRTYQLIAAAV